MGEFCMPSLGADMEKGTLTEWRVRPGDAVTRGDIIAVVDTDKGSIEIEVFESGTVEALRVAEGEEVPVGSPMANIASNAPPATSPPAGAPAVAPVAPVQAAPPPPAIAPAPAPMPVPTPTWPQARVKATPAARKLAHELGIELSELVGTGHGGAACRADVLAALAVRQRNAPPPAAVPAEAPPAERAPGSDPATAMRRAIAAAMATSKREIPHYYLDTQADMRPALAWLSERNAARTTADRILPAAVLLRAMAIAAQAVPAMNGFWRNGGFEPAQAVHLGVGISLRGGGLVAPALHHAERQSVPELMANLADLVRRTRRGHMRSSELTDGTITMTSLGDQGVERVFGIIYPPQVALVGVGRIAHQPLAVEGGVIAAPVVKLTLAADHRASDGATGSDFLRLIRKVLENPEAYL